jgi:cytochrome c-type biogenesis protein CcmF
VSKEAAFLVNNWILLFCAFFVLFATMFPTLTEAVTNQRITVSAPFFNRWLVPIGLALLLLTGIGPLLAWRKSTLTNLREEFLFSTVAGWRSRSRHRPACISVSGLCFGFAGFVMGTIAQEFWRGARSVRNHSTRHSLRSSVCRPQQAPLRLHRPHDLSLWPSVCRGGFKQVETVSLKPVGDRW